MKTVTVTLGNRSYNIYVGTGLLKQAGRLLKDAGLSGKAIIITDSKVCGLYGEQLRQILESADFDAGLIDVPEGEQHKSIETAGKLYQELVKLRAERTTPILALGGGVIGDLAGFVAATYMRGVPLVQVPTTLLAQGDSSIGGKVAVDHGNLKNMVGAFYHPRLTISDVSLLKSLSQREISSGLAEIMKHGLILDADLFRYLEKNMKKIKALDENALETIVFRSAQIKARVVEKDELDLGPRNVLNYGHTVGHAVESVSGMKIWHGEAVAIGMVAEARISNRLGKFCKDDMTRLTKLIKQVGLPTELPPLEARKLLKVMQHDKKVLRGKLRFALPKAIGEVFLTDEVEPTLVQEVLTERDEKA